MPQEIRFSPIFALNLGIREREREGGGGGGAAAAENLDAGVVREPSSVCPNVVFLVFTNCRPKETCYKKE